MGRLGLVTDWLRGDGPGRYVAPAAFLLAATIAVLLIRSALHHDARPTGEANVPTAARTTTTTVSTKRVTTTAAAQYHTIESGDTFGALAERYGTTIDTLRRLNPSLDPNALTVGAKIRIR